MTATSAHGPLAGLDLADPRTHAERDLGAVWQRLRDEAPVTWHPAGQAGFWVVTRHADALAVYRDPEGFSSTRGNVLATLLAGGDPAGGQMLVVSDGPRNLEIRRLLLSLSLSRLSGTSQRVRVLPRLTTPQRRHHSHLQCPRLPVLALAPPRPRLLRHQHPFLPRLRPPGP